MRYRQLSYAYTLVIQSSVAAQTAWRPAADVYETASAISVMVELPGVHPDEMEVLLFQNALVVEGQRRVPDGLDVGGIYHTAEIRRGPFRAEIPLPARVEAQPIEMHCELGLLSIKLAKVRE